MAKLTSPDGSYVLTRPRSIFPVTRQLSYPLTHILYYLPISPNQITALSMAAGLAGAWWFAQGDQHAHLMVPSPRLPAATLPLKEKSKS